MFGSKRNPDPVSRPIALTRQAVRLGELLVAQGALTPAQVVHLLDVQAVTHRPFGDLAERLFGVAPQVVAGAWVEQFVQQTPSQDVSRQPCDPRWLVQLDRRQAWQFRMVPMRRELGHVLVAVERRSMLKAVNFAGRVLTLAPCFVLAEPGSLRVLLMRHYPVAPHLAEYAFAR